MARDYGPWIRDIERGAPGARALDRADARAMMAAMLAGEVPDPDLAAMLVALRAKGETLDETLGFLDALGAALATLEAPPERPRPVVLPSYHGARRGANLTPLVALMLARYGVPVLVHGLAGGGVDAGGEDDAPSRVRGAFGRVTSAAILWELGVAPSATVAGAAQRLRRGNVAYLPTEVLSPGLARLLGLRSRAGLRSTAHALATLVDPFGHAVRVIGVSRRDDLARMRAVLAATRADAMLLRGTEGEPYANPRRMPRIEMFRRGQPVHCVDAEVGTLLGLPALPVAHDAVTTAHWIAEALDGAQPVPAPIVVQLGCLLEAAQSPR
jgi:anthranilate phosphoribosyltransferase